MKIVFVSVFIPRITISEAIIRASASALNVFCDMNIIGIYVIVIIRCQ